jgi:predicted PurR-regulated permease PerM
MQDKASYVRGREMFIRLSLLAIMGVSCAILMRPFLNLIICGIILAIGVYPAYRILTRLLHGRAKLAAALCCLVLMLVVIVPSILLGGTLVDGVQSLTRQVKQGRLDLPPVPESLQKVPVVGPPLHDLWTLCSTNLEEGIKRYSSQLQKGIPVVLGVTSRVASTVVQFLLAILFAGYLLATSEANSRFADRVFIRIFGDLGPDFKDLVGSTIRTVTNGILGVAVIQTAFAGIGFWLAGLRGAGLWALFFLIASVLQIGTIVLLPVGLLGFLVFPTTKAVIFFAWCIIVGLLDNVLKPLMLGRGAKVPMGVIFLGVLGGFIMMNSIIGLFVGAIVLSVGYKLFIAWLDIGVPPAGTVDEPVDETIAVPSAG